MRFRTALVDGRLQTTGETFELAADAIFKAIGQGFDKRPRRPAGPQLRRASASVDEHLRTSIPGVYAGGDCTSLGQDLTVQAVQHGKLAAEAIMPNSCSTWRLRKWPISRLSSPASKPQPVLAGLRAAHRQGLQRGPRLRGRLGRRGLENPG
jgi:pyruvate/2-oxoglutarate dehydrogenase complex dihydrolipoamide dehydrogenase (E3) component